MKILKVFLVLLMTLPMMAMPLLEKSPDFKPKPVASIVKGKVVINYKALSKKTAGGEEVTGYRMLFSKDKEFVFLVQEFTTSKSKVKRYIPLEKVDNVYVVGKEPEGDWIDCWLMRCSTCEETISGSGAVWCECSTGGCLGADTSDPWKNVAEKLFR